MEGYKPLWGLKIFRRLILVSIPKWKATNDNKKERFCNIFCVSIPKWKATNILP